MRSICLPVPAMLALCLLACGEPAEQQASNGAHAATKIERQAKRRIDLDDVPPEVLSVALSARPNLSVKVAEHAVRNGRDYYDLGGIDAGAEVELDIEQVDGEWQVVEVQRDIDPHDAPAAVSDALREARPDLQVRRVIESDEGAGLVKYIFLGAGADGHDSKVEVSYDGRTAHVLTRKRIH
ncbi:MAG TPA: hypothetical protein VF193_06280 [Steroidobacter sp.]